MTSGKSFITAFTSSSPRQPIEPVGQASSACNARRLSALDTGWALTKDVAAASPKTEGAICRQASQSMQVESTKKSPGTFSGTRFLGFAITGPLFSSFYPPASWQGSGTCGKEDCRSVWRSRQFSRHGGTHHEPRRKGSLRQKYVTRKLTFRATLKCLPARGFGICRKGGRYVQGLPLRPRGPGGWWTKRIFN